MVKHLVFSFLFCASVFLSGANEPWKLVWSDEFEGTQIDPSKWAFDLGNGFYNYESNQWISGWGNAELQYYTRDPENVCVRAGSLHIRAIKESLHGCGYSSARLKTRSREGAALFAQKFGRFEFRAKLPTGQGIWPALWMLPLDDRYGAWAASGEIDVMETRGQEPDKILGTLHYGGQWPSNVHSGNYFHFSNNDSISNFHVYAVEWDPGEIRWYVDEQCYATQTFWWSSSLVGKGKGLPASNPKDLQPWPAPFDQPFYLVMNLAVGGRFPGNPDLRTAFPAEMIVDYVRVFQRSASQPSLKPRGPGKLPF
jgi:beta-glucanase (GH16 family)